jgi:uncharacterized lipoprotein YddW (UPF0748 family)
MNKKIKHIAAKSFLGLIVILILACSCKKSGNTPKYEYPSGSKPNSEKPRFIWIDAAANFPDFANSKENITRDLTLAKNAGFTDIVVDIRPTSGDVLYNSSVAGVQPVAWLGAWVSGVYSKITRTATWDYLQAFIDAGHTLGLKVHAGFNTMVGGNSNALGSEGILYRDASKKEWATSLNTAGGVVNTMDVGGTGAKFFNPANDQVQDYIIGLLKDLAKYNLDGIIIDRGRYDGIGSDFSNISRQKFQTFLGSTVTNYPSDILPPGATMTTISAMTTYPMYFKQWLEFRVKTIYDFMNKAKAAVKSVNQNVKFGVYVGGWYSTYYEVGVNWASQNYNVAQKNPTWKWASANYQQYGFAGLMDEMLIGAYASPLSVNGTTEWTMQGFAKLAKEKISTACPMVAAGPDVGNWDPNNNATQDQENQAIVNSVKACMDECDGYFLFDMIHLKQANQWQYVKQGVDKATQTN